MGTRPLGRCPQAWREEMAKQRWVKANVASSAGRWQGAKVASPSLGGVSFPGSCRAGWWCWVVYLPENDSERLRRIASYGLSEGASAMDVLQVVRGCRPVRADHVSRCSPACLRTTSGFPLEWVGAAPVMAVACAATVEVYPVGSC